MAVHFYDFGITGINDVAWPLAAFLLVGIAFLYTLINDMARPCGQGSYDVVVRPLASSYMYDCPSF